MDKLFQINNETTTTENDLLLCEIGDTYACTAIYNEGTKEVNGLDYYTYPPQQMGESIKQIFSTDQFSSISKKVICSGLADAVLVPYALFNEETKHTFFSDVSKNEVLQDKIAEWQIVTVYALPKSILGLLNGATTNYYHTYTPTLRVYNGFVSQSQVAINFTPQQFSVLVKKEGQLLLAQTYSYSVPLDVVYYLLSIYEQFDLSKSETYVLLSGLIEEDSSLYKELNNYFLDLHFHSSTAATLLNSNYPKHYFTSLLNLAACV